MVFEDIQINNRLQVDIETLDSGLASYKGIILDVTNDSFSMVTDFGKLITINKDDILSIAKTSFDRIISSSIVNIKNFYQEKKELEDRYNELIKQKEGLIEDLFDSNMLSRFNITGAKNRLDKSIPKGLLNFNRGIYNYKVFFSANPNNEIEINFKASYTFEYYNSENIDSDKIIRTHAPKEKDVIKKSFNDLGRILEIEKNVVHEKKDFYTVFTTYQMLVEVDAENFLNVREKIKEGLSKLKR